MLSLLTEITYFVNIQKGNKCQTFNKNIVLCYECCSCLWLLSAEYCYCDSPRDYLISPMGSSIRMIIDLSLLLVFCAVGLSYLVLLFFLYIYQYMEQELKFVDVTKVLYTGSTFSYSIKFKRCKLLYIFLDTVCSLGNLIVRVKPPL